ncbi:hypothetical protein SCB71_17780 [Herbiconiux sp. KACC 21604]|uniref:hypothetical protein n=1 Tax=unclassified Herbiconiux TaxID=2618217 RepID=UPI0014908D9E|nr:hypothetical protein [Herbiconiux sp. SALV-R1]QJU54921.1 hypothetical protein HL652_15730 [Herbiconiux sp. SALV-R1]WPO86046.1 hypothetical protein SCB71_17780 [Herbiconiux sp. KACC 21604]
MDFRSKEVLEQWLEDFRSSREGGLLVNVLVQDGTDGADTGLVVVPLRNAPTDVYMQPVGIGEHRWSITLNARTEDIELDAAQLHALASELEVAASLCSYLQERSAEA